MELPPLSVPVKEAREAESAAPRIGNLDGFGGGSSEPVDPATNPNSLVISCTKTVERGRLRKWSVQPLSWGHIWVTNFTELPAWENSLHSVAMNNEILHNLLLAWFCSCYEWQWSGHSLFILTLFGHREIIFITQPTKHDHWCDVGSTTWNASPQYHHYIMQTVLKYVYFTNQQWQRRKVTIVNTH